MNNISKLLFVYVSSVLFFFSCKPAIDTGIGIPKIQAGTAKITGKIESPNDKHKDDGFVEIFVPHPISGETFKYKTAIDQSGRFSIDIDVETDISMIGLHTSLKPYNSLLVKVRGGAKTNINITYSPKFDIEDVQTKPEMNKYDIMRSLPIMYQILGIYDSKPEIQIPLYDKRPEAYIEYVQTRVSEKLKVLKKDSLLSKEWKAFLSRDFRILNYRVGSFDYERSMKFNFRNTAKDTTIMPTIQKTDKSYFGFLKGLDLNNPQYLICSSFMDFQREVLKNDTLALPEIGERDIPSWLASVKAVLSDLVGFKDGQYYDVLAANAYGRQLIEEVRPLTEKQKANTTAYWKEGKIAKILLRKNQQIVTK